MTPAGCEGVPCEDTQKLWLRLELTYIPCAVNVHANSAQAPYQEAGEDEDIWVQASRVSSPRAGKKVLKAGKDRTSFDPDVQCQTILQEAEYNLQAVR